MGEHIDRLVELAATETVRAHTRGGKEIGKYIRKGDGPDHRKYVASEKERLSEFLRKALPHLTEGDLAEIAAKVGNSEV